MDSEHTLPSVPGPELKAIISRRVQALLCGMCGHDLVLKIEPKRLALQCVSCPYETSGWILSDARPRVTGSLRQPARAA